MFVASYETEENRVSLKHATPLRDWLPLGARQKAPIRGAALWQQMLCSRDSEITTELWSGEYVITGQR